MKDFVLTLSYKEIKLLLKQLSTANSDIPDKSNNNSNKVIVLDGNWRNSNNDKISNIKSNSDNNRSLIIE